MLQPVVKCASIACVEHSRPRPSQNLFHLKKMGSSIVQSFPRLADVGVLIFMFLSLFGFTGFSLFCDSEYIR